MEKFKKLSMLVIGVALLTLTSMSAGYSAVIVQPDAENYPDYYVNRFPSIKEALNWFGVWSPSNPDLTIMVKEGTYNEGLINIFSDKNGVTIQAQPGDTVIVNGGFRIGNITGVTIEGLRVNGVVIPAFQLTAGVAHDCSILNNYATSTSVFGVISLYANNFDGTVISGNVIYSSPANTGIQGIYPLVSSGSITIDHNTIYGFTSWSIYFIYGSSTITNNLITSSAGLSIAAAAANVSAAYNAMPINVDAPLGFYSSGITLGAGNFGISVDDVKYSSTNPAAPDFLYLSCDTSDSVLLGASDGGYIGALPIYGSCNEAPVAVCKDITIALGADGQAAVTATAVDGGSYDPDGDPITLNVDVNSVDCSDIGAPVAITLTVSDGELTDSCEAIVTGVDNLAPVVGCALIKVDGPGRSANNMPATAANFRRVHIGSATDNCGVASIAGAIDGVPVANDDLVKISVDPTQPTGRVSQGSKGYIHIIGPTGVLKVTATDVNSNVGTCEATP